MSILIVILLCINMILVCFLLFRSSDEKIRQLQNEMVSMSKGQERGERSVREEISRNREELMKNLALFGDSISRQLSTLTQSNEQRLEKVRDVIDRRLHALQEDNMQKLEKMRETVDEKLHSTLEKRLGESFKVVSERLEKVHQGLGEMQNLALGVGDLKKVLSNVKARGTWGEVQLGNLLDQILSPEQYERNVITKKGTRDPVEFAIKLPGREDHPVLLPIDAKFPLEDYQRLLEAQEAGHVDMIEEASKAIENKIKLEAKNIRDKYLDPPNTTDFGILFLPIEGLYAEVLRRPGFFDRLQREFRITVTGPTTILALLNSLQMGFRTLAVEKRASEVWTLLGKVKTDFGKFGDLLQKTHDKLKQASDHIELAERKSRTIEQKLKNVQELPVTEASRLIEEQEMASDEFVEDKTII